MRNLDESYDNDKTLWSKFHSFAKFSNVKYNQYVNHVEIFSYGILTYFFKYSPGMIFILCNVVKGPCCKEFIFSFSRRYIFKNTKISYEWPRSRQSQQPKLMLQYRNGHHLNLYPQTNAYVRFYNLNNSTQPECVLKRIKLKKYYICQENNF